MQIGCCGGEAGVLAAQRWWRTRLQFVNQVGRCEFVTFGRLLCVER